MVLNCNTRMWFIRLWLGRHCLIDGSTVGTITSRLDEGQFFLRQVCRERCCRMLVHSELKNATFV